MNTTTQPPPLLIPSWSIEIIYFRRFCSLVSLYIERQVLWPAPVALLGCSHP